MKKFVSYVKCCRVWPVAVGYPVGKCGHCGDVPEPLPLSEWPNQ